MMRKFLAIVCSAAAVVAQTAQGAETKTLKPSSPWNVDYSEDSCALKRLFGEGDDTVLLELRQLAPGDDFSVTVASKGSGFQKRPPKVRFIPEPEPRTIEVPLFLKTDTGLSGISWPDTLFQVDEGKEERDAKARGYAPLPPRPDAEYKLREGAVTGLEVASSFEPAIFLATGAMHQPMQAMRKCLDALLVHWGIDAAAHRTLSRSAWPIGQARKSRQNKSIYPLTKLSLFESGSIRVRMMVGADGKPTGCHIRMPSQEAASEQAACYRAMKIAHFEPALDAAGKPIASYFVTQAMYVVR